MFSLNLETIVAILTITGILIKAGYFIFKWLKKQYQNITTVHQQIDKIFKEITPNGGGSIKDKINLMSKEITSNTEMTEQIFHRQRWIMENRDEAIFEAQPSGELSWVNKPYTKLTGRDSTSLVGHNWKNTVFEEDRERVIQNWQSSVNDRREFEDEYRIILPAGQIITVHSSATYVCGHGYIGSIQLSPNSCVSCSAHNQNKEEKKL